jgi:hypothetical protein
MKTLRNAILAGLMVLGAGVGACGGSSEKPGTMGVGGMTGGMTGSGGMAQSTGGTGGLGGAGGAIPLVDWVTDLATNDTTDISTPDTVDDKNIADTQDSAAFDPLLH